MKIARSLATRIVLAALWSGLVGAVGAVVVIQIASRGFRRGLLEGLRQRITHNVSLDACQRDPARFVHVEPDGITVFAYDAATSRSANSEAPALDASLAAQRASQDNPWTSYHFRGRWGGAMIFPGRSQGPCSLLQARWPRTYTPGLTRDQVVIGVVALALCTILEVLVAVFGVFVPLLRRLGRLEQAATFVGAEAGFASDDESAKDELGGLARSLRAAHERIRADNARLERARQATEHFLADVTHDLRTPIASLQITVEELADLIPAGRGEGQQAGQAAIRSALSDVVYLGSLVANLRLATRLREGWDPMAGNPGADLAEVIRRVLVRERVFARRKGVALEAAFPDEPVNVRCDPTMAEQAVTNLVQNAITYNEGGGHVSVVLETRGDCFGLSVRDDGPGVPPAELPRLAERTFRSDLARQRDPRGSGLGLAIVSEVVARCGWRCVFTPAEPHGLVVTIDGAIASS